MNYYLNKAIGGGGSERIYPEPGFQFWSLRVQNITIFFLMFAGNVSLILCDNA